MDYKLRKILLPINIKLSLIVLLVTGVALGIYVYLAIQMFKTDKIAYVFESVEDQSNQVSLNLENYLKNIMLTHDLLPEVTNVSTLQSKVFNAHPEIQGFYEYVNGNLQKKISRTNKVNEDFITSIQSKISANDFYFDTDKALIVHRKTKGGQITYLVLDSTHLMNLIPESKLYEYHLKIGSHFLTQENKLFKNEDLSSFYFQTRVIGKFIVNITPLLDKKLIFMTSIPEKIALNAATQLKERSYYFGGLVAGSIILVIILISGLFTRPIKKLYNASLALANKEFSHRVQLKERDEIGVLGDSFNFMASEIENYLEEMKEKSRLENELKTAHLVQRSFFPTQNIQSHTLELDAYYQSATECGGDWWGYLRFEQSEVIIIVDVTGHGTAAALLTAVIHNSLTAIKKLSETDHRYKTHPELIMSFLNESFCGVNINLNATAFVAIIDKDSIHYANASHNPPYLISFNPHNEYAKRDFFPLMDVQDERLGESFKTHYQVGKHKFKQGDQLILYTDGILEAKNNLGKAYGSRNFIRDLIPSLSENKNTVQQAVEKFYSFLGGTLPDDDITLLKIRKRILKLYLHNIKDSIEVNQKIERMGLEITEDIREANIVLYSDTFKNMFLELGEVKHINHFIGIKDFLKNENILSHQEIESLAHFKLKFTDDSVTQVTHKINSMLNDAMDADTFVDFKRFLQLICIELVQNALIFGKSQQETKEIELDFIKGKDNYSVTVRDGYGELDQEKLLSSIGRALLEKNYENKKTGAGLGLSMVLSASDEIVIKRKEGEFTEIRSIINKYKRLKEYKSKKTSLHYVEY
ncbi:MAG: hypothetical protein CME62_00635 [Halobacteriovoraceae bacterium]|nr:hypothetical protein [Halobacteriovoraceae bacterium]|tara:strand:- start:33430 stop:35868 length:2439 start_codon:yes stop_codon:yes gene_type:complete